MFHVFRLNSDGYPTLLETCIDLDRVHKSIDLWSDTYPHAFIDYVYKDSIEGFKLTE